MVACYDEEGAEMADAKEIERIRRFVRKNRQRYLEQGLRKKLIEDGHDPEAVDLVLAEGDGPQAGTTTEYMWGLALVSVLVNALLGWQVCDAIAWIILVELFILVNFIRLGNSRAGDETDRGMQRVMGRGCGLGFLLSLPVIAYWLSYVPCRA
jgi:hypothetical protein